MGSKDRLKETKSTRQKIVYSRVNKCDITNKESEHAKNVWKKFSKKKFLRIYKII